MKKQPFPSSGDPGEHSGRLLARLDPSSVGMFRFLLEAWDNVAGFTVLDRREALLKIFFAPGREQHVRHVLDVIGTEIALTVMPWPGGGSVKEPRGERGQPRPEQPGAAHMAEQGAQTD